MAKYRKFISIVLNSHRSNQILQDNEVSKMAMQLEDLRSKLQEQMAINSEISKKVVALETQRETLISQIMVNLLESKP